MVAIPSPILNDLKREESITVTHDESAPTITIESEGPLPRKPNRKERRRLKALLRRGKMV